MSRTITMAPEPAQDFPRVSGDEPGFISGAIGYFKFSPRERG